MKQDKWTQQLRDKLDGYEVDVPEDLWAGIEAGLARRSRFVSLRRWAVAASLIACLAGGGVWWWSQQDQPQSAPTDQPHKDVFAETDKGAQGDGSPDTQSFEQNQEDHFSNRHRRIAQNQRERSLDSVSCADQEPVPVISQSEPLLTETPTHEIEQQKSPAEEQDIISQLDHEIAQLTPSRKERFSLSVYSENGISNYQNSNGVMMAEHMAENYYALYAQNTRSARSRDVIYLANYEERQKHDRPVSVGLSVNYPLSSRISITSGAVVTWLHSTFENIIREQTITRNQKLVYLGIPLSVNYRLWQYKGLKLYALAGGQADWNVSADTDTNGVQQEINKDRIQWSVHTNVGLEFCPIPQLGFYVEPGVKYYFDNGSKMQNYFKDKPLNLNIQFGLRLNLNDQNKLKGQGKSADR